MVVDALHESTARVCQSSTATNLDLSLRPRPTNYGILFMGFIHVPSDGNDTFHLQSDSGAQLFIHDSHVIDDDYLHSGAEASGSVHLAAGLHPVRLYYRHKLGAENLSLDWQGPGVTRAAIPDSALFRPKVRDTQDLWLPLNESEGLIAARASGTAAGTLTGFANDNSQWVFGRHGFALKFDNANSEVTLTNFTPPIGTEARTIAAWIKADSPGAITAWGNSPTSGSNFQFRIEDAALNTGAIRLEVNGGFIVGSTDLTDGQWHHVALTFEDDGTPNVEDVKLYIDGTPEVIASVNPTAFSTALTVATVGVDPLNRHFDGLIDEFHIYRRVLNAAEVAALANATGQVSSAWHLATFGDVPIDFSINDDGDGLDRFTEFAFGGDPFSADPLSVQPSVAIVSGELKFTARRRITGKHDLTYSVTTSNNLQNWAPAAGISEDSATDLGGDIEQVIFDLGSLSDSQHFLRFEATQ